MNFDLKNNLFNNSKENNFVENFIKELSNFLKGDSKFNNLLSEDLTLYDNKIISKFKNKMLIERRNILQNYAEKTKEQGEMFYIYDVSTFGEDLYNLLNPKTNQVITKSIDELPAGSNLGSVLRKNENEFKLDNDGTKFVGQEINSMIKGKIKEQNEYLETSRIEGHRYQVDEKYSGRMWLYDLDKNVNGEMEGIEEIDFPKDLYEIAKKGNVFVYKDGKYKKE